MTQNTTTADTTTPTTPAAQLHALWRLDQCYAVITGASRGIGFAVAQQLLERGATVLLIARGQEALQAAATTLAQSYDAQRIMTLSADLSTADGIHQVEQTVDEHFPRLDILINNVGTNIRKPVLEYTVEEYQKVFDTNLYSAFELSRRLHSRLLGSSHPAIVNISSVAGLTHLRTGAPYAMTKAALIQLTRNMAVEWAATGIRVNAIAPWYIDTPLAAQVLQDTEYLQEVLSRTPLQRIGSSAEAAAATVFLALPAAGYITGQTLAVDGGFTVYGF